MISIPGGIIGFPDSKRYVLLDHKPGSSFLWLQSLDDGGLAFVLIDPFLFKPDYELQISREDSEVLELENGAQDLQALVIVNIGRPSKNGRPVSITANLLGPIVINAKRRLAKQVILGNQPYSHRHPIPTVKN